MKSKGFSLERAHLLQTKWLTTVTIVVGLGPLTWADTVTTPIDQTLGATEGASTTINSNTINVTDIVPGDPPFAIRVQGFGVDGASSSDSNGGTGASMGSIGEFQTYEGANLNIGLSEAADTQIFGIFLRIDGGRGGDATNDHSKYDAGAGGSVGGIGIDAGSNAGDITFQPGTYGYGLALWEALLNGGDGGNVTSSGTNSDGLPEFKDGGHGGTAGSTGSITLSNSGQLTAGSAGNPLSIGGTAKGIHGATQAGNPGQGSHGIDAPSAGGVSITNSGPINLYLVGSSAYQAFGIRATAAGGNGSSSFTSGSWGGTGGGAGAVSVTLSQGGDIWVDTSLEGADAGVSGAGIQAGATGGHGGNSFEGSDSDRGVAGHGGNTDTVDVAITDASVTTGGDNLPAIELFNQGGNGGDGGAGQSYGDAGPGGQSGASRITLSATDESVASGLFTNGDKSHGITALATGGHGGQGANHEVSFLSSGGAGNGGNGGIAGGIKITLEGSNGAIPQITTQGDEAIGILAQSTGGNGGQGGEVDGDDGAVAARGSSGGSGGAGGEIILDTGNASIQTSGAQSHGVVATSQGGTGGGAGTVNSFTSDSGHNGGQGGDGGAVTVTLGEATGLNVNTSGDGSFGIVAQSIGKNGGKGGDISELLGNSAGDGGNGGAAGQVAINLNSGSSVETTGTGSHAVVARGLSGDGGAGGSAEDGTGGQGGDAGSGGDTGTITLNLDGTVTTYGDGTYAVLSQAMSGAGGDAGDASSVFYSGGGSGGTAGTVGAINVTLGTANATTTHGEGSHAFLLQSIAGGGGSAAQGGAIVGLGGDAGAAGDGGDISFDGGGNITTTGDTSIGVVIQSIAGGGGDGGDAKGIVSIGSDGAAGGSGGGTTFSSNTHPTTITTSGQLAHALVNQSIGGGGGNAGNATADGAEISVAVGGTGGAGGTGGFALTQSTQNLSITTGGSNAIGIVNQSIGGGGGTGGSAYSHSVGVGFDAAVGVGGSGGVGGSAGNAKVNLANATIHTGTLVGTSSSPTNLNPVDAYGIVVQSLAGGGGLGGSATATALAEAVPVPETESSFSVSTAASVGGSGGIGGSGESAELYLGVNTAVTTHGQGSHALIVQSIGGGGGVGGDSSTSASSIAFGSEDRNTVELNGTFSMGGGGGGAGQGGQVIAYIGANDSGDTTGPSTITTYGDFANGLLAQSIGGGGGNAGFGSGNTQDHGSSISFDTSLSLGATGGAGGAGGKVDAKLLEGSSITTYGAGSHGIVAQSIGGGGGTSQGGSLSFGGGLSGGTGDDINLSGNITIGLGKDGGSGSDGGVVEVLVQGVIITHGGDAVGVLAQSIGGGGGIGGSSGADASTDNPINPATGQRQFTPFFNDGDDGDISLSATFEMELGGGGGEAADGGTVSVTLDNSITTSGDWAKGILAQSIGGGGGKGGTAVAQGTDATPDLSIALSKGGQGGQGGHGRAVAVRLNDGSFIQTSGYGAFGAMAQSIGGGGGVAADGSGTAAGSDGNPGTIAVGGDFAGNGGNAGNGGAVVINTGNASVATSGDFAHGLVMQSIGGGGGMGGQGSSISGALGPISPSMNVSVGGGSGANGTGGLAALNAGSLGVSTQGNTAIGILLQSIGGGGGIGWAQPDSNATYVLGGNGANGNGGAVTVTLGQGSQIQTSGLGSHGVLAQSIGGGGGIIGHLTGTPTQNSGLPGTIQGNSGDGGTVNLHINSKISTTGDGAHGIFAQSIGGGGGVRFDGNAVNMGSAQGNGVGGAMTVVQNGQVTTTGNNSSGLLVQQDGGGLSSQVITVTINGDVTGGSGSQGYGAWILAKNSVDNSLTVNSNGSLQAASGVALRYDTFGGGKLNVTNNGTISGSVQGTTLPNPGPAITINNMAGGRIFAGPRMEANINNAGRFYVGQAGRGNGFSTTVVTGDFTQSSTGSLLFNADFGRQRADFLHIHGNARFAGKVVPFLRLGDSILPDMELALIQVDGSIEGGLELDHSGTALFEFGIVRRGNRFNLAVTGADFTPDGLDLVANQQGVADHLTSIWDAGGNEEFGRIFAALDVVATFDLESFGQVLYELSPGAILGFGARAQAANLYFTNAVLNGPIFEGETAYLSEVPSSWARVYGRTASQQVPGGFSDLRLNTTVYQVGGQAEVRPDWFLGGSIAYQYDWMNSKNGTVTGEGHTGLIALTAKHQREKWLFAGALTGSYGWHETKRTISLPGYAGTAEAKPNVQTAGVALRAAYTHATDRIYVRPMVTLNGVYARSGSFRENGLGPLDLEVDSADQAAFVATPALEVGGRTDFVNGWVMRSFVGGGMSFSTNDDWRQEARFAGAPDGANGFTTTLPVDTVTGRLTAGCEIQFSERTTMFLQYEGEFSQNVVSNGGAFGVKIAF